MANKPADSKAVKILKRGVPGIVTKFHENRGYGFIRIEDTKDGSNDLFIHINDVQGRIALQKRQSVICDVAEGEKGLLALNVIPGEVGNNPYKCSVFSGLFLFIILLPLFKFVLKLPWIVSYLLSVNIITMFLYWYDKHAATHKKLRTPEIVLHFFAFIGGTPMAWISQRLFKHKSIKKSFQIAFWCVFLLQIFIIYFFATELL